MQNDDQTEGAQSPASQKNTDVSNIKATFGALDRVMENPQVLAKVSQSFIPDLPPSDEEDVSEVESFILEHDDLDEEIASRLLLTQDAADVQTVDPETQARLEALLEAAGIGKLSTADGKAFADPDVLRRLTSSVSCALDEAAAALTRMRVDQGGEGVPPTTTSAPATVVSSAPMVQASGGGESGVKSLASACSSGDIGTVKQLLDEGRSVHETTEEGESLLSLACSAGYFELAQVLLAMRANVEDRGIKGECTPLMEASSGGYVDIVKLLIKHGADVNAQSSAGNTPLHYAACGGHDAVVRALINAGANVEEHNENGHTPLMESASAGHVSVAKILLKAGAGINTHSNEFKESALTLACYKGHLEMVKYLLEAGADQEHKTDEMHTALMEASMDGHVEVARLLLDSGAQVNMPADSFESPLTLAACGGHVELANLLIERGANLEEVNDEGYTPLMEAAREGHEEMVALLLAHGADLNAQTEETQETALTLSCCGGFLEVADFLIKAGADRELGCSTPLMEAAQEGHLDLVKYLLKADANVHAQTQTGDTALTYACENGHTDVAEVLLQHGAVLEHESEGGRTPLMKAARAGHLHTVQFLITKGGEVNKQTSTNDHTALSLASAGGHHQVLELLLRSGGNSIHRLKDGSTMLIEAAKGGHTNVVNLLLDWPNLSNLQSPQNVLQLSPPHTVVDVNELPRVPVQGLSNIVPPQDPRHSSLLGVQAKTGVPLVTNLASNNLSTPTTPLSPLQQPGFSGQTLPGSPVVSSGIPVLTSCAPVLSSGGSVLSSSGSVLSTGGSVPSVPGSVPPGSSMPSSGTSMLSSGTSMPSSGTSVMASGGSVLSSGSVLSASGSTLPGQVTLADLNIPAAATPDETGPMSPAAGRAPTSTPAGESEDAPEEDISDYWEPPVPLESDPKASERLEAFISKMMRKAELLNTTREEQAVKKQQILEELQKVEKELQEKARMQMLLNSKLQSPSPPASQQTQNLYHQTLQAVAALSLAGGTTPAERSQLQQALAAVSSSTGTSLPLHVALRSQLEAKASNKVGGTSGGVAEGCGEYSSPVDGGGHQKIEGGQVRVVEGAESGEGSSGEEADDEDDDDDDDDEDDDDDDDDDDEDEDDDDESVGYTEENGEQGEESGGSCEDLSHVVPVCEEPKQKLMDQHREVVEKLRQQQHILQQHLQLQLVPHSKALTPDGVSCELAQTVLVSQPGGTQLHTIPLLTVLDSLLQQNQLQQNQLQKQPLPPDQSSPKEQQAQLQQQCQQLQTQLVLQQQLQHELQQQLKLQQEHRQLQQQLQGHPVQVVHQLQMQQQPQPQQPQPQQQQQQPQQEQLTEAMSQFKIQPPQATALPIQYPISMELPAAEFAALAATTAAASQDVIKLQQVQQHLQELHHQLQHVQQLQNSHQLTQAELIQQAQQLQMQLQQAQQLAQQQQKQAIQLQLPASSQITIPTSTQAPTQPFITQQDLLQQAQQLQQQLQQAQQLQQLAQKQLNQYQSKVSVSNGAPVTTTTGVTAANIKKVKKKHQLLPLHQEQLQQSQVLVNNQLNAAQYQTGASGLCDNYLDMRPGTTPSPASPPHISTPINPPIDVDAQTESNHDTALTLACAGGHAELVSLLLARDADIEHRDKKGFTPLILAATAGHAEVVEILLDHSADIEAQSERTKDTPLSLACSGGRYEVVELLLSRGANKEHRNVSDYTPLSLAASGGYVNIIKLLLSHSAEINSRTGSKLGISPLMLAAMNGHVSAVKMLLDMGSDINAQIETNKNTALTLACFQGRHEVVSLLVDRKANIEHRAKTGLTPLMEAASGGYVEVGRVLLDKYADVNAAPVPSSKDTALTIAADKGHYRFVELLLSRMANIDVKNKKGNSPLWLACNGGHLDVVQLLVNAKADVDSQDNRKVSCLMAAFRKGHVKVVKWLVRHVTQYPSDQECTRYMATINNSETELLKKCHQCMEIIVLAKEQQAQEANRNAAILLEQIDKERSREEIRKAAAVRKREKKKQKKKEKQEQQKTSGSGKNSSPDPDEVEVNDECSQERKTSSEEKATSETKIEAGVKKAVSLPPGVPQVPSAATQDTTEDTTQAPTKSKPKKKQRDKDRSNASKRDSEKRTTLPSTNLQPAAGSVRSAMGMTGSATPSANTTGSSLHRLHSDLTKAVETPSRTTDSAAKRHTGDGVGHVSSVAGTAPTNTSLTRKKPTKTTTSTGIGELDDFGSATTNLRVSPVKTNQLEAHERTTPLISNKHEKRTPDKNTRNMDNIAVSLMSPRGHSNLKNQGAPSPKRGAKKEEGWKEVVRKSKKVSVPSTAISRVIGRSGCNINAIREVSGAHIEVDKAKGQGDRTITIKGSADATRQATNLINALVKDPDKDIDQIIPRPVKKPLTTTSLSVSGNVWHNSMANGLPVSATSTSSAQKPAAMKTGLTTAQHTKLGSKTTQPNIMTNIGMFPIGAWGQVNSVPQSAIPVSAIGSRSSTQTAPISTTGLSLAVSRSPSSKIVRQLFADQSVSLSTQTASPTKSTASYSTPAMAKTKLVTVTSPSLPTPSANKDVALVRAPVPAAVVQPPSTRTTTHKTDPQPLPIKPAGNKAPGTALPQRPSAASNAPGQYQPFQDNFFTQVAERFLNKKEEAADRINFAAVAAAGVVATQASMLPGASPITSSNDPAMLDPVLQAKAPGYKAPGSQRTASPKIDDLERAPGYKPPSQLPPSSVGSPLSLQVGSHRPVMYRPHGMVSQETMSSVYGRPDVMMTSKPSPSGQPMPSHSPRSSASVGSSPRPPADPREEYSQPNHPMTLPRIESNLNPNAPDFMSRPAAVMQQLLGASSRVTGSPFGGLSQQDIAGGPPLQHNLADLAHHMSGNEYQHGMHAFSAFMGGSGGEHHQYPPMNRSGSAASSAGASSKDEEGVESASAHSSSAPSPTDPARGAHSAVVAPPGPPPMDPSMDRPALRPIGTERHTMKASNTMPGTPGGHVGLGGTGELPPPQPASGLWSLGGSRDWLSNSAPASLVSVPGLVVSSSSVTSTPGGPPHSATTDAAPLSLGLPHPHHLLAGTTMLAAVDPAILTDAATLQEQSLRGAAPTLLMSSTGEGPVYANGIPGGTIALQPYLTPVSQVGIGPSGDGPTPAQHTMWKPGTNPDPSHSDPGMSWKSWNPNTM